MYLLRAGAIEQIESLIRKNGMNPHEILAKAELNSALLRQPETLISYSKLADLLDYCSVICKDPFFGIHLAQIQSPFILGELTFLLNQQPTLKATFEFAQKYLFLHAQGLQINHIEVNGRIEIHMRFDFNNQSNLEQLKQMSVSQQFEFVSMLMPKQREHIHLHFTQSIDNLKLNELKQYKELVKFNSHFNGISCPANWQNITVKRNDDVINQYLRNRILTLNTRYPNDLASQVRYLCSNLLPTGECKIATVSSALGLQPRVLQKRLKKEGHSFRTQLQLVRQQSAEHFLRNSDKTITDIALHLGYAETSVFCRNFKKWTGLTPKLWRKKMRT
jgi:AraC-like DNA-binding protein